MRRQTFVFAGIQAASWAAVFASPGLAQSQATAPPAIAMDPQAMPNMHDMHDMHDMNDMNDMNKLSQALVNPLSGVWNINNYIQVSHREGSISPEEHSSTWWGIQPLLTKKLTKSGWTTMNRPSLPIFLGSAVPRHDATGQFEGIEKVSGLGDFTLQSNLGKNQKTSFGSVMWGFGVALSFPTATDDALGSGKYSAGPGGALVAFMRKLSIGAVVAQYWSFAGKSDRQDVNEMMVQPIYYWQLGGGWQIGDNPMWHLKWNGSAGGCAGEDCGSEGTYIIPLGLGLYKTTKVFSSRWRFGVTPRYYVKTAEQWGNKWGINFTATLVVPNPYMKKMKM